MLELKTKFAYETIPLWDDLAFYVDSNSKVTAGNGTFEDPKPNAFSLPHISTCPGSTPQCRASCYVHGLEANAKDLYRLYQLNAMALNRILESTLDSREFTGSTRILGDWIKNNCEGGFRWHVSGDVFSSRHAFWIADVCNIARDVNFWIYTRSDFAIPILSTIKNLVLNVSVDKDNYKKLRPLALKHGARLCYLTSDGSYPSDLQKDSVIFPDYALRGRELSDPTSAPWWRSLSHADKKKVCPADFFGQSRGHRCGPCAKCMRK